PAPSRTSPLSLHDALPIFAELLEAGEGGPRDAYPSRVAVVDEDRRRARLVVEVGRQPADVPAVAHRQQRQHRDLRVLRRVQRAEDRKSTRLNSSHQIISYA